MSTAARDTWTREPEMSVVVLSYRGRPTLFDAVRSLRDQDVPLEIVVVNSAGGEVPRRLAEAGLDVQVIDVEHRLFPGGARNLGIAATRARFVAFLADDCIARPGWARARLRAHRGGSAAVGSALDCDRPAHPISLAAHLSLFNKRMPRTRAAEALRYGASYDRRLFEDYGLFRDDMEGGEDTEFHSRLPDAKKPGWHPEVVTVHRGPSGLGAFLSDQFRRGRRNAEAWQAMGRMTKGRVARQVAVRIGWIVRHSPSLVERRYVWAAYLAVPLIVLGGLIYALGASTARSASPEAASAGRRRST